MAGGFARLRGRNQLTLPQGIVERMELRPGDLVEFAATGRGKIEVRAARIVTRRTPEAKIEEAAAKEDIRQGRYTVITDAEHFRQRLDKIRQGAEPAGNSANADELTDPAEVAGTTPESYKALVAELVEEMVEDKFRRLLSEEKAESIIRPHAANTAE